MKIRLLILLYSVPLFIVLAALNGAFLFYQEKSELLSALDEQAVATAVTVAEFIAVMENPHDTLEDPVRHEKILIAAGHIDNLDGLVYMNESLPDSVELSPPATEWNYATLSYDDGAGLVKTGSDNLMPSYIIATSPAGPGAFVAARINADFATVHLKELLRNILFAIILSGITGACLAWHVSGRIVRELRRNENIIEKLRTGEILAGVGRFTIREAHELSDALRLIDVNRQLSNRHLVLKAKRECAEHLSRYSLQEYRKAVFPPVEGPFAEGQLALGMTGDAPPGCFYCIHEKEGGGIIVAGECAGDTQQDAFSMALFVLRYLEQCVFARGHDMDISFMKKHFSLKSLKSMEWTPAKPLKPGIHMLSVCDSEVEKKAGMYCSIDKNAAPGMILKNIETLLDASGLFIIVKITDFPEKSGDENPDDLQK